MASPTCRSTTPSCSEPLVFRARALGSARRLLLVRHQCVHRDLHHDAHDDAHDDDDDAEHGAGGIGHQTGDDHEDRRPIPRASDCGATPRRPWPSLWRRRTRDNSVIVVGAFTAVAGGSRWRRTTIARRDGGDLPTGVAVWVLIAAIRHPRGGVRDRRCPLAVKVPTGSRIAVRRNLAPRTDGRGSRRVCSCVRRCRPDSRRAVHRAMR